MKDYIEERVLDVAKYIIDSKATIRKTAKVFGVSKSTIHKDMTERLPKINPAIAEKTHLILVLIFLFILGLNVLSKELYFTFRLTIY